MGAYCLCKKHNGLRPASLAMLAGARESFRFLAEAVCTVARYVRTRTRSETVPPMEQRSATPTAPVLDLDDSEVTFKM